LRNLNSILFGFVFLLTTLIVNGSSFKINGNLDEYVIDGSYYELYIDSTNSLTIDSLNDKTFTQYSLPLCEDENSDYWVKFNLNFLSEADKKWVLEIYEHHIDHFTCYIPWKDSTYKVVSTGDTKKYLEREYRHINFVFDIHQDYIQGRPFYFKIKSPSRVWAITSLIRTNQYYTFYAVNEYYLLGFFYGILFIMGIYNLLFFFSTKENIYIYYSLYIASVALFSMLEDGIGFAYLWSNKPYLTEFFGSITRLLIMLSYVIYSMSFLKLNKLFPQLARLIKNVLFIYAIEYVLEKSFNFYIPYIYSIPYLIIYGVGIYTFIKGYKPARFFIAGSTFVLISILTMLARDSGYVTENTFINTLLVYALNIGITIEIVILSVALGDRIRYSKQQEEESKEKIILQLQENETLKNKVNLELEDKVRERTHELESKNKDIFDSLNYALRIQNAVLPSQASISEVISKHFIFHSSKDIVSGDFYWFYKKENLIFAAAVDCTGHGVPGAFMSIMGSNLLHFAVRELQLEDPGEILDRMSFELKKRISSNPNDLEDQYGMDMALCVINNDNNEIKYSGAFNPLVIISKGKPKIIAADRFPLGRSFYDSSNQKFKTKSDTLQPGDCVYLFSDGFKDQFGGENGDKYATTNFYKLLERVAPLSMEDQKASIENEFYDWKGGKNQIDDVLVIGLEV